MKYNLPLTIYLVKEEYTDYKSILDEKDYLTKELDIKEGLNVSGKAFIGENRESPPKWNNFLDDVLIDFELQLNQSSRAILFVRRQGRIFAFTFGHGRHLLKDKSYERNFGLKVILNNAKRNSIKSIDTSIIDEKPFQNRTQASRASRMEDFNLSDIRTLYRGITAESTNEDKYGHTIHGKDNFRIHYKYGLNDLNHLCDMLWEDYNTDSYLDRFPEIDRIIEVKDPDTLEHLNKQLIKNFKENKSTFLMIPDVITWEDTEGFSYTEKGTIYPFLTVADFWENKKIDNFSLEKLKSHHLYQRGEDDFIEKWSIFKCIFTEVMHKNKYYVFSIGEWFEIKRDLVEKVDEFINKLSLSNIDFPDIRGLHEEQANIMIANDNNELLNMDRNNMQIDNSPYEVCDLLSKNKKFIHVKWWDSSATLSHLFSQGKVSGEIIANDSEQRICINKRIDTHEFKSIIDIENFAPEQYTIVFAIIYKGNKTIAERLPFFSKINLMQAVRELSSMRYHVEIAHIKSSTDRLSKKENETVWDEYMFSKTY